MTKVQLGAFLRERHPSWTFFFVFLEKYDAFSLIDVSRILMMLRHNSEIHQIVVGEILHIMSMVHRAIMHLSLANLLYGIIIMESSCTAYHIDNLAVALMGMKTC